MKRFSLALASLIAAPVCIAQTPLEALHSASIQPEPLYSYDISIQGKDTSVTGRVDPSAPMGERLTIISPAEADWTKEFAKRAKALKKNTEGNIWCQQFKDMVPETASLLSETETLARYSFQPSPDDKENDLAKIAKHLDGVITLEKSTGQIQSLELIAREPFKPVIVAKVNTFQFKVSCTAAPNGLMRIATVNTMLEGRAMGKAFSENETQTMSNLQAITPAP